jgi:cyclophilin family peptidyl-prolyl cis-trans isomerase
MKQQLGLFLVGLCLLAGCKLYEPARDMPADSVASTPQEQQTATNTSIIQESPIVEERMNVTLHTSKGDITIELFADKSPKTVENFVTLAKDGFYDQTSFHRVIPDFMIQGGDPLSKDQSNRMVHGTGGPDYMFDDEFNDEKLVRGSLAMANRGPNTNGSQFFIVTAEATPWLDGRHTNFGKVVSGMEVVEMIEATETDPRDNPLEPIVINSITIEE